MEWEEDRSSELRRQSCGDDQSSSAVIKRCYLLERVYKLTFYNCHPASREGEAPAEPHCGIWCGDFHGQGKQ
ncbi:hypothetical protein CA54_32010 [Symmachiella macrocystis]|uniref:Uncharacterized protein n=1 Tax=Symmachiella macrocystis TaxID=2527985 RepID=A0A5C6BT37_9PLAN|nr:hypothetical protein CA54_32010 [Symmachiella macrocystis]